MNGCQVRVLIVTGIFPPDHGGPAGYVPRIAEALIARGHEVLSVITLSDCVDQNDSCYRFPVIRIRRKERWLVGRRLETILLVARMARYADVVYINGLPYESVVAAKIIARRPVVLKAVGDLLWETARNKEVTGDSIEEFQKRAYGLKWWLLRLTRDFLYRRADRVIVPSEFLKGIVAGWISNREQSIEVIYNSIEPPQFKASEEDAEVDLVSVARLVSWKGIGMLIEVAKDKGWTLNVVGEGPLRQELERAAGDCLGRSIRFLGHVPQEKIFEELARGRVFILNSSYEGLPHIVLEAMATPVPVVATSVGGTPETIQDGVDGFLVAYGDERQLVERIYTLLNSSDLRRRFRDAGYKRVVGGLSFENMVNETEHMLAFVSKVRQ